MFVLVGFACLQGALQKYTAAETHANGDQWLGEHITRRAETSRAVSYGKLSENRQRRVTH